MQQKANKSGIIILIFATIILQLGGHKLNFHKADSGTDKEEKEEVVHTRYKYAVEFSAAGVVENLSRKNWTNSQKLAKSDYIMSDHGSPSRADLKL